MKKIIYILSFLFLVSACDLTETPYTVSRENLMDSPEGADLIVTSIYDVFWSSYMMKKTYMEWIDMDHDHASAEGWVVSGAGMGNVTTHWGYNGSSDLFMAFFRIVSRSNFAIESIPSFNELSDQRRNQLIGEAYFLRAFAYFHLVRMYGPVPLRLTFDTPRDMARSSVKDVYEQIVADLKESDRLMSDWGSNANTWGRANKIAAKLLLAKVYANMGSGALSGTAEMIVDIKGVKTTFKTDPVAGTQDFDPVYCYTQVREICDTIIAHRGKEFDLRPNYQSIWGGNNKRNNEFVWGIAGHNDFKTEHLNYYYAAIPFNGRGWAGISKPFYALYEAQDNRGEYGIFHFMKRTFTTANYERFPDDPIRFGVGPDGNPTKFSNFSDLVLITKWYIGDVTQPTPVGAAPGYSYEAQDVIMLRFAEAYLLRAEALNELGQSALALADLDVIRTRANATLKTGSVSDKTQIRSFIYEERALEFAQEFNRKFDLLRWGLYLKVMNTTETVPTRYGNTISKVREPRSILYAVPTTEVSINKLFGSNNEGWQ